MSGRLCGKGKVKENEIQREKGKKREYSMEHGEWDTVFLIMLIRQSLGRPGAASDSGAEWRENDGKAVGCTMIKDIFTPKRRKLKGRATNVQNGEVYSVEWLCLVPGEEVYEKVHRYFRRLLLNRAQNEKRGDVGAVQPGIQAGMEVCS